jgi:predicted unusual protein kinase regulating ubiquinone biosynthesis (AarF/ABC1/UbiB family)
LIAAIGLLLSFGLLAADADVTELRSFVRDVVSVKNAPELRQVFKEHPRVIDWVVQNKNLSELYSRSDMLPMPIQAQYEDYYLFAHHVYESLRGLVHEDLLNFTEEEILLFRNGNSSCLDAVPDLFYEFALKKLDDEIQSIDLASTGAVKLLIDPVNGIDLKELPENYSKFLLKIANEYFNEMPLMSKKEIIKDLMGLAPGAPNAEKLSVILNNAGPALQKLLQLYGKNAKTENVGKIMKLLKSGIKPVPFEDIRQIIENSFDKPLAELFPEFKPKPIGVATIAQVHLARSFTGAEVVVKVRKPGVDAYALHEIGVLKNLAQKYGDNDIKKLVGQIAEAIDEELDLRFEHAKIEQGKIYNSKRQALSAASVVEDFRKKRDVLVMKKAVGKSIEAFPNEQFADVKLKALNNILEKWFDNAIFGNGFFHADLHEGNIFMNYPENAVKAQVTLIDFGSASTLSITEKKAVIKLMLATINNESAFAVEALSEVSEMEKAVRPAYIAAVEEILKTSELSLSDKVEKMLVRGMELGITFKMDFMLFYRAKRFLEKQIDELNKFVAGSAGAASLKCDYGAVYQKILVKRLIKATLLATVNMDNTQMGFKYIDEYYKAAVTIGKQSCTAGIRAFLQ